MTGQERAITRRRAIALMGAASLAAVALACTTGSSTDTGATLSAVSVTAGGGSGSTGGSTGGDVVHTGQLYFGDTLTDRVFTAAPSDERSGDRTRNDQDGTYANGGPQSTLRVTEQGDGEVGTMTMGVRTA